MNYTNQATRPTMTISTIHMNLEEKLILRRIVVSSFYCIGIYFRVYKLDNMHDNILSKKSKMITANMFINKSHLSLCSMDPEIRKCNKYPDSEKRHFPRNDIMKQCAIGGVDKEKSS